MEFIKFKFINKRYTSYTNVTLDRRCNGIQVVNIGSVIAYVNDFPIHPASDPTLQNGEGFVGGGNIGELYDDRVVIRFDPGAGAAVMVTEKVYITPKE
jgi:hypothetical protein